MVGALDQDAYLKEACERFSEALASDRENRISAIDDLRMLAGEQWPDDIRSEREEAEEPRPCLTINRLPQFAARVEGDIRLNPPAIRVRPVEDADDATADVYEGLTRSIEDHSNARNVYSNAAVSAAQCGMGHFRLRMEHADDETFNIDLRIRRIKNPLSVIWDPASQDPSYADARYCFVVERIPRKAFEEEYPNASPDEVFSEAVVNEDWNYEDAVTVAEYWTVETQMRRLIMLADPANPQDPSLYRTVEVDDQQYAQFASVGLIIAERMVPRRKVSMCIITGKAVLEEKRDWPGNRIPIFTVSGREVQIGERTVRKSLISDAKDSQRLLNYMRSASVEMLALAPKAPWLVTDKNIEGREDEWANANAQNLPYLSFRPDNQAPGYPRREPPPPVQAALLQESALAADDMKATTGIYDAALGAQSNETSGIAIQRRQQEADVGTYVFQDNLRLAVRECGAEIVRLIPLIYDAPRTIRILGANEAPQVVQINQPGGIDLTRGKYDVTVQAGPGHATKRQEAAEFMTQVLQSSGDAFMLFGDLWARNLDIEGADELKERLEMVMQQRIQAGQPSPEQQQMQMMQLQAQMQRMQLENQKLAEEIRNIAAKTMGEVVSARGDELENQLRARGVQIDPKTTVSA